MVTSSKSKPVFSADVARYITQEVQDKKEMNNLKARIIRAAKSGKFGLEIPYISTRVVNELAQNGFRVEQVRLNNSDPAKDKWVYAISWP